MLISASQHLLTCYVSLAVAPHMHCIQVVYCELREPFIFNLYEPSPNESNTAVGGHLISEINAIMPQIFKQMHEDNLNDVVCSRAAAAAAAAVCVCVCVYEFMSSARSLMSLLVSSSGCGDIHRGDERVLLGSCVRWQSLYS